MTQQQSHPETRSYDYDAIGNRKTMDDWDGVGEAQQATSYVPNQINQYDSKTTGAVTANYLFDEDGNLTQDSKYNYTYDAENRLSTVTPITPADDDKKQTITYDYMGRRIKKSVQTYASGAWGTAVDTFYVYDGWNVVQELDGTGQTNKSYVWGLDLSGTLQGAGGIGGLLAAVEGANVYNYLYDANGNVTQVIDATNALTAAHYEYDPFGSITWSHGAQATINPFRFSTKHLDTEIDLYYYGYRYYSPELGKWLNRDPLGDSSFFDFYSKDKSDDDLQGLFAESLRPSYLFVSNDPINAIDAFGLKILIEAHHLLFGWNHSKITIIPECQASWSMDNRFACNTTNLGEFYATLGAGPDNNFRQSGRPLLISNINRTADLERWTNIYSKAITLPAGFSEDDFIIELFDADSKYGDNLNYSLNANGAARAYNSNSYVSGLLRSLLGTMPSQPPSTPGFTIPVPSHHFR